MGVVIRRWVWLETIGVVSGCFPHITYISLLHLYLFFFAAASYFFFHFVKIYIQLCTARTEKLNPYKSYTDTVHLIC